MISEPTDNKALREIRDLIQESKKQTKMMRVLTGVNVFLVFIIMLSSIGVL